MDTFKAEEERDLLNSLASGYRDVSPYSEIKKNIIISLMDPYLEDSGNKTGIQFGCANGYETQQLASKLQSLVVLDGSTLFIDYQIANNKFVNISYICSLFEEYDYSKNMIKYDYIFCNYVLEHVFNPQVILKNMKDLLKPNGRAFIVVPNRFALSRQIALHLGLLKNLEDLSENDRHHGHRRIYCQESIIQEVECAGFSIIDVKGVILKILADFQLNELMNSGFLEAKHILAMHEIVQQSVEYIRLSDSILLIASH